MDTSLFDTCVGEYCNFLAANYVATCGRSVNRTGPWIIDGSRNVVYGWDTTRPASKYLRIVRNEYYTNELGRENRSSQHSHSFVVLKDDPKFGFVRGDILKAATWKTPATNYVRGNIFDVASYKDRINWTGVVR